MPRQVICSILRNYSQKLPRRGINLEVNVQITISLSLLKKLQYSIKRIKIIKFSNSAKFGFEFQVKRVTSESTLSISTFKGPCINQPVFLGKHPSIDLEKLSFLLILV